MGDRTWTSIRFSGRITTAVAEELVQELRGQGCLVDEGPRGELTVEHLKLDQYFYDADCNYADMDGVEACCREHSITYCKTWQAGGDYGPGMMIFTGEEQHDCGTLEGEPVVTRSMLTKLGTGILEYFDRFDFSKYPPLEIVDEPATSEQEAA